MKFNYLLGTLALAVSMNACGGTHDLGTGQQDPGNDDGHHSTGGSSATAGSGSAGHDAAGSSAGVTAGSGGASGAVGSGDQAALVRARGALVATSIAEYFRGQGKEVLLMVDSVTRVAMAWREIGLAVGEPPTTKGYPPSVFAALPRLLERAGTDDKGSITGIYTVLVDGDDFNEPIADASRSILDGHIVLTRKLAAAGHYPSIDILESKSRVRDHVITTDQRASANAVSRLEASYREKEDLILVGAYHEGSDRGVDAALRLRPQILEFLQQTPEEHSAFDASRRALVSIAGQVDQTTRRS